LLKKNKPIMAVTAESNLLRGGRNRPPSSDSIAPGFEVRHGALYGGADGAEAGVECLLGFVQVPPGGVRNGTMAIPSTPV
jgi:hypothetical protein